MFGILLAVSDNDLTERPGKGWPPRKEGAVDLEIDRILKRQSGHRLKVKSINAIRHNPEDAIRIVSRAVSAALPRFMRDDTINSMLEAVLLVICCWSMSAPARTTQQGAATILPGSGHNRLIP